MDAISSLSSRLEAIQAELVGLDKQRSSLQAEQKEVEAALRVIGRYAQEQDAAEPIEEPKSDSKPSISLTDATLQIVQNSGAQGATTAQIKGMLDLLYGFTNVKATTLSVTMQRHKVKQLIKNVNKTWFLSSLAPIGTGGDESPEVAASGSYQH